MRRMPPGIDCVWPMGRPREGGAAMPEKVMNVDTVEKPFHRTLFRRKLGLWYYSMRRYALWMTMNRAFARERRDVPLPYITFEHKTPLMRKLKDVDMWMQKNKVKNLSIAVPKVNAIIIRPGQVFSYWRLIGRPSKRKGYVPGMILREGAVISGTGGGLCQLSNLIFWMAIHTPLTIVERHRHRYDVFPDSNRTQPFGSDATCYYPHGDLMIRNDTPNTYQLMVEVGEDDLIGSIRCDVPMNRRYEIVEREHQITNFWWGGFCRHNELWQQAYTLEGQLLEEKRIVTNDAIMMYTPYLESSEKQ